MRKGSSQLFFGTSNKNKFDEAKRILEPFQIDLRFVGEKGVEIQSSNLEEIAAYAAKCLAQKLNVPVVVEDAGLFIRALKGFPGPYSSFVEATIGIEGVLQLMSSAPDRSASFASAVAFCTPNSEPASFQAVVEGQIAERSIGSGGFGFDPIFVPAGSEGRTFAEMQTEEKNALSHRSRAFKEFARWYSSAFLDSNKRETSQMGADISS